MSLTLNNHSLLPGVTTMTLDEFLSSPQRNAWIRYETAEVYLRKSKRIFIVDDITPCIDIATISVRKQGTGTFTRLIKELHEKTKLPLFLENTHIEFAEACRRHGWMDYPRLSDEKIGIFCLYLPYATIEGK